MGEGPCGWWSRLASQGSIASTDRGYSVTVGAHFQAFPSGSQRLGTDFRKACCMVCLATARVPAALDVQSELQRHSWEGLEGKDAGCGS